MYYVLIVLISTVLLSFDIVLVLLYLILRKKNTEVTTSLFSDVFPFFLKSIRIDSPEYKIKH